jgi:UDP:flavonoid glycosyltransferase YjiC (YdhE family)
LKIILISVGTRGDVEPFLAIGELLRDKGHQVICAFPEQFRELTEGSGLSFASLGANFLELLDSDVGKAAIGGSSGLKKLFALLKLARTQNESQKELASKQYEIILGENPDRVLYNSKAMYPIIWGVSNKGKSILLSSLPYMHYVIGHSHIAFNRDFGPFINKLTYGLFYFGIVTTAKITMKWLKISTSISRKQIRNSFMENKVLYAISPSLFPRPPYWKENLRVSGYNERNKAVNWKPDAALKDFLAKHVKILLITFGSMINPEPEEKTKFILDILERNNIPAIINTASGGLEKPEKYNTELIHFVSGIPYDWILPKIYAFIHHGGSGTTHMALKYGCATMIIPHIIDQFVWNNIIFELGSGPKGMQILNLTSKSLEPKILELLNTGAFKERAEQIASQMEKEDLREELYQAIIE